MYSWERRSSGSSWTTVSNDNTTSYTTNSNMAVGQYAYRCVVRNEAGRSMSRTVTVNVYGEYCINRDVSSKSFTFLFTTCYHNSRHPYIREVTLPVIENMFTSQLQIWAASLTILILCNQ